MYFSGGVGVATGVLVATGVAVCVGVGLKIGVGVMVGVRVGSAAPPTPRAPSDGAFGFYPARPAVASLERPHPLRR